MAGLEQNISQVSPSTLSSETIAIAVIAAFPLMSILNAYAGSIKSLWSLVLAFYRSKYTTKAREQEDECVDLDCIICLGEVSLDESQRVLPLCGHGFHTHCIEAWLQINSVCPICRNPVPNISIRRTNNRFLLCLLSALANIWNWFLDPLSSEVMTSLSNEECDFL